jgi:hypothetical protein
MSEEFHCADAGARSESTDFRQSIAGEHLEKFTPTGADPLKRPIPVEAAVRPTRVPSPHQVSAGRLS